MRLIVLSIASRHGEQGRVSCGRSGQSRTGRVELTSRLRLGGRVRARPPPSRGRRRESAETHPRAHRGHTPLRSRSRSRSRGRATAGTGTRAAGPPILTDRPAKTKCQLDGSQEQAQDRFGYARSSGSLKVMWAVAHVSWYSCMVGERRPRELELRERGVGRLDYRNTTDIKSAHLDECACSYIR